MSPNLSMSSEQFQAAHDSIYSTGVRLLQYIQQIREGRRSEGNDSFGLKNIEDNLNKALPNAIAFPVFSTADWLLL